MCNDFLNFKDNFWSLSLSSQYFPHVFFFFFAVNDRGDKIINVFIIVIFIIASKAVRGKGPLKFGHSFLSCTFCFYQFPHKFSPVSVHIQVDLRLPTLPVQGVSELTNVLRATKPFFLTFLICTHSNLKFLAFLH